MLLAPLGLLVCAFAYTVISASIPARDLALSRSLDQNHKNVARALTIPSDHLSNRLLPRMDVWDPQMRYGDILPGRRWAMNLVQFVPIVGAVFSTISQLDTDLQNFYRSASDQMLNYPSGSSIDEPSIFFRGPLMSLMIEKVSGADEMTADMVRAFLIHMAVRLTMGGFRGIYTMNLRQLGGGGLFSAVLQSNPYWEGEGIQNLPGPIGLAAMGF